MNISSNFAVALALGDLNKNNKQINKIGKRAASGMLLNSAADGSSDYSISEKMQARIRCLNQDDQNVKTGTDLLQLAEGAIQSQINILKTVKAKVIEANNDTCTDSDRAIIQKEIDQAYEEIDDIAYETNYNGLRLLNGDFAKEKIGSWITLDQSATVIGTDELNFIPDNWSSLDGLEGPFDVFKEWSSSVSDLSSKSFTGGKEGTRSKSVLDLRGLSLSDLEGAGLFPTEKLGSYSLVTDYVLTRDPSKVYGVNTINYSSCTNMSDVANEIAKQFNAGKAPGQLFTAVAKGETVEFESILDEVDAEDFAIDSKAYPPAVTGSIPGTGLFSGKLYLSGGRDRSGVAGDVDNQLVLEKRASLTFDFSKAKPGTGITMYYEGRTICIEFQAGTQGFVQNPNARQRNNVYGYTLGVDAANATLDLSLDDKGNFIGEHNITFNKGVLTYNAPEYGAAYSGSKKEDYWVIDGIKGTTYDAITDKLSGRYTYPQKAADGPRATITGVLSDVAAKVGTGVGVEAFIGAFVNTHLYYNNGINIEFIDTKDPKNINSVKKDSSSVTIDLDKFRQSYKNTGVQKELAAFMVSEIQNVYKNNSQYQNLFQLNASGDDIVFYASEKNLKGNAQSMKLSKLQLRSYTIDTFYKAFVDEKNNNAPLTADEAKERLDGKGFRAYCATDSSQWFNFIFYNGKMPTDDDKPKSGDTGADIKSIYIDISNIKDEESLVEAIYDQGQKALTTDPQLDHFMRLARDTTTAIDPVSNSPVTKNNKLVLYDWRGFNISSANYPWYQEKGAKIADGSMDDVVWGERDLYVKRLVIHHTDRSSANIKLDIPNTDLKSIYGMDTDYEDLRRYNVLTKSNRKRLLGTKEKEGALDYGINYLTGAQTLIGAQVNHLKFANENITTQHQYTTAAESQIRDADMAHTMTEYAKANVLGQASQTMLAQANQNSSQVLSLLQG